jgi:hypothetical protein
MALSNLAKNTRKLERMWKKEIVAYFQVLSNVGRGEARRRKYKRYKVGGGQAYDPSSD